MATLKGAPRDGTGGLVTRIQDILKSEQDAGNGTWILELMGAVLDKQLG